MQKSHSNFIWQIFYSRMGIVISTVPKFICLLILYIYEFFNNHIVSDENINNKLTKNTCYNYINFYCRFSLENGYRHIDCAKIYLNEKEVGQVFNDYIGKSIAREDLFIIGKVIFIEGSD